MLTTVKDANYTVSLAFWKGVIFMLRFFKRRHSIIRDFLKYPEYYNINISVEGKEIVIRIKEK